MCSQLNEINASKNEIFSVENYCSLCANDIPKKNESYIKRIFMDYNNENQSPNSEQKRGGRKRKKKFASQNQTKFIKFANVDCGKESTVSTEEPSSTTHLFMNKPRMTLIRKKHVDKFEKSRNFDGQTDLHELCLDVLKKFANIKTGQFSDDQKTYIISQFREDLESVLIEGANPNVKDHNGSTPLMDAVCSNNYTVVEILLKNGAWVNTPTLYNETPLLKAVLMEKPHLVKLLLQYGADVNLRSEHNLTPLTLAEDNEVIYDMMINNIPDVSVLKDIIPPFDPQKNTAICCNIYENKMKENIFKICSELKIYVQSYYWCGASHIITKTDESGNCDGSFNIHKGILDGCSIVSIDWLTECHKQKAIVPVEPFEVKGTKEFPNINVPRISRLNSYKMYPKLFSGCHIAIASVWQDKRNTVYSRQHMVSLIRDSGAIYIPVEPVPEEIPQDQKSVMFHAKSSSPMSSVSHVILFKPYKPPLTIYNTEQLKTLPVTWFLKCIETFSIYDP